MMAALLVTQVVVVSAKPSPSGTPTVTNDSKANYEVVSVDTSGLEGGTAEDQAAADLVQSINSGSATVEAIADANSELSGTLEGKKAITPVFDVNKIGNPEMVNGRHKVSMKIPNLASGLTDVAVIHYSPVRHVWESVEFDMDLPGKIITGYFIDLSPVVIVAKEGGSGSGSGSHSSGSGDEGGTAAAESGTATSPKTGVESDWALWMCAAVIFMSVSGIIIRKSGR